MKNKPSNDCHSLSDSLNLTNNPLFCKMALSLLPSIKPAISISAYNKLQGNLRRGDLDSIQDNAELKDFLSMARSGAVSASVVLFRSVYQFVEMFKKLPPPQSSMDQDKAALQVFLDGEKRCAVTNRFLRTKTFSTDHVHWKVKSLIAEILGDLPTNFLDQKVDFGPGSTVNPLERKYAETSEFFKLSDKLYVSQSSKVFLAAHLSYNPVWIDALASHYHINDGDKSRLQLEMEVFKNHLVVVDDLAPNRLGFVPKNADVSRTIGVELNGQIVLQQCVGRLIRKKLRKYGLNLNSQSRNQHLARLAKTLGLATVDIKNASNTLSIECVRKLIPSDWFCVLDTIRQKCGRNKNHNFSKHYDMFSSMGNGFTFELESLIFFAIAVCVNAENGHTDTQAASVYGDDIIVPTNSYTDLVSVLRCYGFTVNKEKSFSSGLFYESCGADYYDSAPVRPFYVRRQVSTIRDAYFLCNSLLFKMVKYQDITLLPAYIILWRNIPSKQRLFGPLHFEGVTESRWDETNDDLEACLRVPLEFAQMNGGVKFNLPTYSYVYKRYQFTSPVVPLSQNHQYAVQNILYLMFLKNGRRTKVTLRGHSKPRLVKAETSRWDGLLNRDESSAIKLIFSYIAMPQP